MKTIIKIVGLALLLFWAQVIIAQKNTALSSGNIIKSQQQYGNSLLGHVARGDYQARQGNFQEALLSYDQAIAQDPAFAEAYIKRALMKYRLGWTEQARRDYDFASRLNPYVADLYGYGNHFRKLNVIAFEPYALLFSPNTTRRLQYYASLFPELSEAATSRDARYDLLALLDEQAAISKNPAEQHVRQAVLWLWEKQVSVAERYLDRAIAEQPTAPAYDLLGLVYQETKSLEAAEAMYQRAIALDSTYAFAYYNLSLLHHAKHNLNKAQQLVNQAIKLNPELHAAYFHRAMLSKTLGDAPAALRDYDYLMAQSDAYATEILLNRAIARQLSGDVVGALEDMNRAIEQERYTASYYYVRGNIYILLENYFAALADYDAAIQLDTAFAEAYFNRGIAYLMLNNRASACYNIENAIQLGYKDGEKKLMYLCNF